MSEAREFQWLHGGGEMATLIRATDWSKTRIGPVAAWPQSLRTMLGVVLGSRFPMLLWWGPDLVHLYNDAYRPILRDKHPESLGAPAAEIWAEVWDVAGPMAKSVQEGGPATWTEDMQLFIKSGDMAEETYFTFSYSPVPGDDGRVAGLLNTVQETTAKVQSERQIRMLHELGARAAEAKSEYEVFHITADVLSNNELDLPFVLFYALDHEVDGAHLVAVGGWKEYNGRAKPARVAIKAGADGASWPLAEVAQSGHEIVVDDLAVRFGPLPAGRWNAQPERAVVLPLPGGGRSAPGFMVCGISPHRTLDERYRRFFRATADVVANVLGHARAYESEKKRAEALAEIDAAKTAFFSNVSHEFRTPLTLMLGPLEDTLGDTVQPLSPPQRARLTMVHGNTLRLLKLVNALLDFSRLESGRLRATYAPLDIGAFTADLAGMFESAAARAGIALVIDAPPLAEPVWADRDMWEKIVPNLVSNAFKFTHAGQVTVTVRDEGAHVALTVTDTGVGIPSSELPHIFDRFYRVSGSQGRTHEGTGIGLALVRELAELHGGTVTVDSTLGKGSTFRVIIPRGFAHLPPEAVLSAPVQPGSDRDAAAHALEVSRWMTDKPEPVPANPSANGMPRARVVVADDNADLREYLFGLLSPSYDVITVNDGLEALATIRAQHPDIVVSDVMMPNLDGYGLLKELRTNPSTVGVPVILLSARAGEESAIEGLGSGADDYLVKPFSARELLARVRTHLELARTRRGWMAEIERANRELETANKELEAFSFSVSHDLRTPLSAVQGFSALLKRDYGAQMSDDAQYLLTEVMDASKRMEQLIEDLLRFSRLGRQPLTKRVVNVAELVGYVLKEYESLRRERSVDVRLGRFPDVVADPSLLKQVFANVVSNAFKFTTTRAHAVIEIGSKRETNGNAFFVKDNGAGFDMAHAGRLFGVFQRLHGEDEFKGTGIGLSLCQRIVHRHGGRIWAESEVDKGATFYFSIPD